MRHIKNPFSRRLAAIAAGMMLASTTLAQFPSALDELRQQYDQAEQNAATIAKELTNSGATDGSDLRIGKLRAAVELAFELRSELQTLELDRAQANLELARQQIKRRAKFAAVIVESRMTELMQSASGEVGSGKDKSAKKEVADSIRKQVDTDPRSLEPTSPPDVQNVDDISDADADSLGKSPLLSAEKIFDFSVSESTPFALSELNRRFSKSFGSGSNWRNRQWIGQSDWHAFQRSDHWYRSLGNDFT